MFFQTRRGGRSIESIEPTSAEVWPNLEDLSFRTERTIHEYQDL